MSLQYLVIEWAAVRDANLVFVGEQAAHLTPRRVEGLAAPGELRRAQEVDA